MAGVCNCLTRISLSSCRHDVVVTVVALFQLDTSLISFQVTVR
jgi:hypothetical protein